MLKYLDLLGPVQLFSVLADGEDGLTSFFKKL